jgi:hypothetical protein
MPKLKIGSLRALHAHITSVLAECDAESAPASQGQDSARDAAIKTAVAEALDRPPSTAQAVDRILANSKINANR